MARTRPQDTPEAATPEDRDTVRMDLPDTEIDPSAAMLLLFDSATQKNVPPNGCTDRFSYTWVDKTNQRQFLRYRARGFAVCRRGGGETVGPKYDSWINEEDRGDSGDDALTQPVIDRAEMVLMKRPMEMLHREQAKSKKFQDDRKRLMGLIPDDEQGFARTGSAEVVFGEDHNMGNRA